MTQPVTLGIIIVTWNNGKTLTQCLDSLLYSHGLKDPHIIVIDNHSADDSISQLKSNYPKIQWVENSENLGFARAVNMGLKELDTDFYLILNPDTQVFPETISRMLEFMLSTPTIGVLGPMVESSHGIPELSFGPKLSAWTEFQYRKKNILLDKKDPKTLHWIKSQAVALKEVHWVSGVCILARKEVIQKTGGLDEHFFMYFEDIDFCHRVKSGGWKVLYYPQVKIIHERGASMNQNKEEVMKHYRNSQKYYYQKNCGILSKLILTIRRTLSKG